MGIEALLIASLVVGAVSTVQGMEARSEAKREGQKLQGEQKAQNAAQAAQERRAQVREERVRRARVLQSAEGTGITGSSTEFGALGALGTNLANNQGISAGRVASGQRSSEYAQNIQNAQFDAQQADALFSLSSSIFSAAGGFNGLKGGATAAPAGMTEATRTGRLPGTQ